MFYWDYSFILPSILVLIIIMGYFFALPRVPIKMNKTFHMLLINEGIVIVLDVLSSWVDNNYKEMPGFILILFNSAFFVFFLLRIFIIFTYTATLLHLDPEKNMVRTWLVRAPFIVSVSIVVLGTFGGFIFYIGDDGYARGPLHFIIYVCYYFYIFYSFSLLYRFRDRVLRVRERRSIFFYNFVLLIGTVFRIVLPEYMLFDTFSLMARMIIFLSFENPEFFLENRVMSFNSNALRRYVAEKEGTGRFKLLAFVIRDYHEIREIYGSVQTDQGLSLIASFIHRNYPEVMLFYYKTGRFVLLGNVELDWEDIHDEIRHRFRQPWRANNAELYLEVGFALIDCSEGYKNADEIINTIGLMLEKADQLGSDFNILADESALQDYEDRIYVKRALENAIDQDAVEIFLQPLIEADSGKLIGAEALARIRDSEGRIIPPGAFIPVAEKNGRINQLGEQVFEKVCRFICNNNIEEMGMKYINVNLSPIQFMRPDLGDRFATIVRRYGIKPDQIHLEITEEAIIDEQMMEKQVRLMQKNGFRFVLDDYGKGYSNLMRIKKTSFVTIKIDMEIVWDYCNSMDAVLPMMISAFKSLGLSITAEGIETEEMANKMRAIGCDYLQGMLFSAPVSVNSFLKKYRYGEDLNV